jgi:hypothetical protein
LTLKVLTSKDCFKGPRIPWRLDRKVLQILLDTSEVEKGLIAAGGAYRVYLYFALLCHKFHIFRVPYTVFTKLTFERYAEDTRGNHFDQEQLLDTPHAGERSSNPCKDAQRKGFYSEEMELLCFQPYTHTATK